MLCQPRPSGSHNTCLLKLSSFEKKSETFVSDFFSLAFISSGFFQSLLPQKTQTADAVQTVSISIPDGTEHR